MTSNINDLMVDFCSVYGDEWVRDNLSEEQHASWVEALYDYYENNFERAPYSGSVSGYRGRGDYEVMSRVKAGPMWGYSLSELPRWVISFSPIEQVCVTPYDIFAIGEDLPETMLPEKSWE